MSDVPDPKYLLPSHEMANIIQSAWDEKAPDVMCFGLAVAHRIENAMALQAEAAVREQPKPQQGDSAVASEGGSCVSDEATDAFIAEVRAELIRARRKFPGDRIMTVALAEEFGELCKAVLDESAANVRKEAVQTAVMAARVALDGDGSVREWRAERGLDPLSTAGAQRRASEQDGISVFSERPAAPHASPPRMPSPGGEFLFPAAAKEQR